MEDAELLHQQRLRYTNMNYLTPEQEHMKWFRQQLVENGAPKDITDKAAKFSSGFQASLSAFMAGWGGAMSWTTNQRLAPEFRGKLPEPKKKRGK
jgi:hypothetical protein